MPWMRMSGAPARTNWPTSTGVAMTLPEASGATSDDSSAWKLPVASIVTGSSTPSTVAIPTVTAGGGSAAIPRRRAARRIPRPRRPA
jgi:hypothetical protein